MQFYKHNAVLAFQIIFIHYVGVLDLLNVYNIYTLIYVLRDYTQLYQQYVFRDHFSSLGSYRVCLYKNMIERLCNGIIINKYL